MAPTKPVTRSIVVETLDEACKDVSNSLMQTARNPALGVAHDFSVAVTNSDYELVTAEFGLPPHLGAIDLSVEAMATNASDVEPDDVFITNDPYEGYNTHTADFTVAHPVFDGDEAKFWVVLRAHQMDVGAIEAGSMSVHAETVYHEGIRIPPTKIVEGGRLSDGVFDLLCANSRTSETQRADLRAMIESVRKGADRVRSLLDRYGTRVAENVSTVLDSTEENIRAEIDALSDQTRSGASRTDTNPDTGRPVTIETRITVDGDGIEFDFAESDEQLSCSINNSRAVTIAAVNYAFTSTFRSDAAINDGLLRPIEIVLPDRSVVNPEFPAPTGYATVDCFQETVEACLRALSRLDGTEPRASSSRWVRPITSGRHPETGEQYSTYQFHVAGGSGATDGADGVNFAGGPSILDGLIVPDPEMHETLYPFEIQSMNLRTDSAGAGEYRGGLGPTYVVSVTADTTFSIGGDFGRSSPPFGVDGGRSGDSTSVYVTRGDEIVEVNRSFQRIRLEAGDAYVQHSGGGGGVGDPTDRDAEAVLSDVRNGYVSSADASETYGLDEETAVDTAERGSRGDSE